MASPRERSRPGNVVREAVGRDRLGVEVGLPVTPPPDDLARIPAAVTHRTPVRFHGSGRSSTRRLGGRCPQGGEQGGGRRRNHHGRRHIAFGRNDDCLPSLSRESPPRCDGGQRDTGCDGDRDGDQPPVQSLARPWRRSGWCRSLLGCWGLRPDARRSGLPRWPRYHLVLGPSRWADAFFRLRDNGFGLSGRRWGGDVAGRRCRHRWRRRGRGLHRLGRLRSGSRLGDVLLLGGGWRFRGRRGVRLRRRRRRRLSDGRGRWRARRRVRVGRRRGVRQGVGAGEAGGRHQGEYERTPDGTGSCESLPDHLRPSPAMQTCVGRRKNGSSGSEARQGNPSACAGAQA